jgi:hypothetical protein
MTRAGKRCDRKRYAVDQIREDETLTADLVDEAAQILLNWSTAQVEAAFSEAQELSETELNACVARLRRFLKRINRLAGQAASDQQAQHVRSLLARVGSSAENDGEEEIGRSPDCPDDRQIRACDANHDAIEQS